MTKKPTEQQPRIPRPLLEKIEALDDHLFLLREALHNLHHDDARLKTLASELRLLVCLSSGTEGLLWRLTKEMQIDDTVSVQSAGEEVDPDHLLSVNLQFMKIPLCRAGNGPPEIPVVQLSLSELIKSGCAFCVQGENLTHERTIGLVANQIGSSHESEKVSPKLQFLRQILINNKPSFFEVLALHADLTLEVGERVISKAESTYDLKRKARSSCGDWSLVVVAQLHASTDRTIHLASLESAIACVKLIITLGEGNIVYQFERSGKPLSPLTASIPSAWNSGKTAAFCLSYSSRHERARIIVNEVIVPDVGFPLGFVDIREMGCPKMADSILSGIVLHFNRFLRPDEVKQLGASEPPYFGGLFKPAGSPSPLFPPGKA